MKLITFFGMVFLTFHASADDCQRYEALNIRAERLGQCQCENFPKELQVFSELKNLKLAAACNFSFYYSSTDGELYFSNGQLYFHGEQVFSGRLVHEATKEGFEFKFYGRERIKQLPPFYSKFIELTFRDERLATKKFKAPQFNEKGLCWEANVVIKVSEMMASLGDQWEGYYPSKYSVLSVSPYQQCRDDQNPAH